MNKHEFIWLDLETTGIDPNKCTILEWAVLLAADDETGDMSEVESYSGVVRYDGHEMDDYVLQMHTNNGLLAECKSAAATTLEEADEFLEELCKELGARPRSLRLAGASVHFDLVFCRVHFPRFAKYLSHRVLDVSTLKSANVAWSPSVLLDVAEMPHRALDDIRFSLAQAKAYREAFHGGKS